MSYSKAIEPFIQKYPSWVYFTGVGGRMLKENNWNTGIKKNIPKHYKVHYTCSVVFMTHHKIDYF